MPYLTPDEIPEGDVCRPLFIPDSTDWLAIVSGALTELTKSWNWEQFGTVTVEEATERMGALVAQYYDELCSSCVQPGGEPIVGLDDLGSWRMLDGDTWIAPIGDYAIPAQTARTETTAEERRCLAAKNAVNVLAALYEVTTDAFEDGATVAEFAIELGVAIGLAIVLPIGAVAAAAIAIGIFALREFFQFADFITEDFWTAQYTTKLECIFFEHATDASGVVSFDFNAIYEEIWNTQTFDLSLQGIRLAGQVQYLMRIIGAEGVNLAGETTAITDSDCSYCICDWHVVYDARIGFGDWGSAPSGSGWTSAPAAQWLEGLGWIGGTYSKASERKVELQLRRSGIALTGITKIRVVTEITGGVVVPAGTARYLAHEVESPLSTVFFDDVPVPNEVIHEVSFGISGARNMNFQIRPSYTNNATPATGSVLLVSIEWFGTGTAPTLPSGAGWSFGDGC